MMFLLSRGRTPQSSGLSARPAAESLRQAPSRVEGCGSRTAWNGKRRDRFRSRRRV